jgi:predicted DCC family thiol-disulfide oxidoreductase YuxK
MEGMLEHHHHLRWCLQPVQWLSSLYSAKENINIQVRFHPVQAGKELLASCGLPSDYDQAIVFIDRGKVYLGSTAALKIGQQLRFPWSILSYAGLFVPRFVRDWVYNQIAAHRYQWFGKRDICMVPTESLKARFL